MENDFDKTIDALLRNARDPSFNTDAADGIHLDADELSMFAENALPQTFRNKKTEHLANCGNCRQILAQLISLNADRAEPEMFAPEIQAAAEISVPWYRRLFIYPNIAYVMGSLVVVFGGLLAFTIIQNNSIVNVSRSAETFPQSGSAAANRSVSSNAVGNLDESETRAFDSIASNNNASTGSNRLPSATPIEKQAASEPMASKDESSAEKPKPVAREDKFTINGASGAENTYKTEDRGYEAEKKPEARANMRAMQVPSAPPKVAMSSGAPEKKKAASNAANTIGDQRFIKKEDVWYDVRYNGQRTINIRRGTSEYKKLDGGLKQIADKLNGTAVILWKEKAYRIFD